MSGSRVALSRRTKGWIAAAAAALACAAVPASAAATTNPFVESIEPMAEQRAYPAAVDLPGGDVLVVGGFHYLAPKDHFGAGGKTAELFDSSTESFSLVSGQMSKGRWKPAAALLGDGRVLVAGGETGNENAASTASAETYDPETEEFTVTESMAINRFAAFAATLPDGRVLVGGGNSWSPGSFPAVASTEIYDPESDEFSAGPTMTTARSGASAAPLPDGRILVVGGGSTSTEIYDPVSETFEAGPTAPSTDAWIAATLDSGRILIIAAYSSTLYEYDPATETFVDSEISAAPFWGTAGAALPGGRALLVGHGTNAFGSEGKQAWIYNSAPLAAGEGVDFGEVPVGEASGPETLTITNQGAQGLEVEATTLTGPDAAQFEIVADECSGETLAFGAACAIEVTVTPAATGPLSAAVELTDNAPSSPDSFDLAVVATEGGERPASRGGGSLVTASSLGSTGGLPATTSGDQIGSQPRPKHRLCKRGKVAKRVAGKGSFRCVRPGKAARGAKH